MKYSVIFLLKKFTTATDNVIYAQSNSIVVPRINKLMATPITCDAAYTWKKPVSLRATADFPGKRLSAKLSPTGGPWPILAQATKSVTWKKGSTKKKVLFVKVTAADGTVGWIPEVMPSNGKTLITISGAAPTAAKAKKKTISKAQKVAAAAAKRRGGAKASAAASSSAAPARVWKVKTAPKTGRTYYYNITTKKKQWKSPGDEFLIQAAAAAAPAAAAATSSGAKAKSAAAKAAAKEAEEAKAAAAAEEAAKAKAAAAAQAKATVAAAARAAAENKAKKAAAANEAAAAKAEATAAASAAAEEAAAAEAATAARAAAAAAETKRADEEAAAAAAAAAARPPPPPAPEKPTLADRGAAVQTQVGKGVTAERFADDTKRTTYTSGAKEGVVIETLASGVRQQFSPDGGVVVVDGQLKRQFTATGTIITTDTAAGTREQRTSEGLTITTHIKAGNRVQRAVNGVIVCVAPSAPGVLEQLGDGKGHDQWRMVQTEGGTIQYKLDGSTVENFDDCAANATPSGVVSVLRSFAGLLEVRYRSGARVQYNPTTQLVTEDLSSVGGPILQRMPGGNALRKAPGASGATTAIDAAAVAALIASGKSLLPAELGVPPSVGAIQSILINLPGALSMTSKDVELLYGSASAATESSDVVVDATTFESGTRQTIFADGRIVEIRSDATKMTQYPSGRLVQIGTDGSVFEKLCGGTPYETEILTGHGLRWVTAVDGSQTVYDGEGGERRVEVEAALAGHNSEKEKTESKMVNTLRHVLMEISASEKNFSANIRALSTTCLIPLRAMGASVASRVGCSQEEVELLFGWIEAILPPHDEMHAALDALVSSSTDPRDIIVDIATEFERVAPILGPRHQAHTEIYDDIRLLFDKLLAGSDLFVAFCVDAAGKIEVGRGKKANPFNLSVEQLLPGASMSLKSKLVLPVQRLPQLRLLAGELMKQCEKSRKKGVRVAAAGVLVGKKADAKVIGAVSKAVDAIGAAAQLCNLAIHDRQARERLALLHATVWSNASSKLTAPEATSRRLLLECGSFVMHASSAPPPPKARASIFSLGRSKKVAVVRQQIVLCNDVVVIASVSDASGDGGMLGDIYQVEKSTITSVFPLEEVTATVLHDDSCSITVGDRRGNVVTLTAVDEGDEPAATAAERVVNAMAEASTGARRAALRAEGREENRGTAARTSTNAGGLFRSAVSGKAAGTTSGATRSAAAASASARAAASAKRGGAAKKSAADPRAQTAQIPDRGRAKATKQTDEGATLEVFVDKTTRRTYSDGRVVESVPGSSVETHYNASGTQSTRVDPTDKVVKQVTMAANGIKLTRFLHGNTLQINPDGTATAKNARPGGETENIRPDCTRVVLKADGTTLSFFLDGRIIEKLPASVGGDVDTVREVCVCVCVGAAFVLCSF